MPGPGEPTADRDFWPVVDAANALGPWVVVDTNIALLDPETIARLTELSISLVAK